jgi:hypothetical protein
MRPLRPSQHHQLKEVVAKIDRTSSESDRRFFKRFQHRRTRVRIASPAEIAEVELMTGEPVRVPPGYRAFAVVRSLAPGLRTRCFVIHREGAETDLSEAEAAAIFERWKGERS